MSGIIYSATNLKTGKMYIGQTIRSLDARVEGHYILSGKKDWKFSRALAKYKKDDWKWEILAENVPRDIIVEVEKIYISIFNTYHCGYNSTIGGEYVPMIDEETAKKAGRRSGRSRLGKKRKSPSAATRKKISDKLTGRKIGPPSKEHRKKLAISKMGDRNPMKRPEVAKKVSEANKGHENNSGTYIITKPDGTVEEIVNLNKYCRINGLNCGNMSMVVSGKRKHHKGYKARKK